MDRKDVAPLLTFTSMDREYSQSRIILQQFDEAELFHGLFDIAIKGLDGPPYAPALPAATYLFDLNPTCQLSCSQAIQAMIPSWQVSLEELPFYLYRQFGKDEIVKSIRGLFSEASAEQKNYLHTILYWVEIADTGGMENVKGEIEELLR